jgi:hypothetical protein
MTDIFVALDLEMTGVDLDSDEIVEISAGRITPLMGVPEGKPRPFTLADVPEGYTIKL